MKKEVRFSLFEGHKEEITLTKLIFYNLLFFVPIGITYAASIFLAKATYQYFEASPRTVVQIFMMVFVFLIFFFIIPFIRRRENIKGVRYALFGFFIVAIGISLPAIVINKDFSILLGIFNHIAVYILLTFVYCPEVLGMDIDLQKWFKSYKQMLIVLIYIAIVTFYCLGFGWSFYNMYLDNENAFSIDFDKPVGYGTFIYYSIVSFTTIGYGDITPISTAARLFTSIEAMVGMITNVIFVAILFVYISNFQAFMKGQKAEMKELKKIERLERSYFKKKS